MTTRFLVWRAFGARVVRPGFVGLALAGLLFTCALPARASTGVSDDRVSLPEGPGSLEGVGENAEVDPNMGSMTHRVPIQVPEGYKNLTPQLALSYSSGAGGSVAGMGWSLPLPAIERLTLRGLPVYDDSDEFAADGSDQLVRLPGTEPPVYRSRFEKGFVRYTWHERGTGAEGYWTAEYPDGRIGYFGADRDGTLVADARVSGPGGTFRYHLVEMTDRFDHHVRYTYDLYGNVTLPRHIGWVFVEGEPTYEVTFQYEERYDRLSDCKPGFNELLEMRLQRINVLARGQRIRYYDLRYEDYAISGGFSRLSDVQLYGLNGGAYPIHETFTYSRALGVECRAAEGCDRPYVVSMGSLGVSLQQRGATLIDINGDALPDVVDSSTPGAPHRFFINVLAADGGHAFDPPFESTVAGQGGHDLSSPYVQVLDVNGDGFTDMLNAQTGDVLMNYGAGDWAEVINLWDTGEDDLPDLQNDFDPSDGELRTVRFIDYNGDKRIDLLRSQFAGAGNETFVFRNTGTGAFLEDPNVEQVGAGFESDALELNDLNGDGLLDPVQVLQSELRYRLNLGWGHWEDWTVITGFAFTDQEAIQAELEDLNGDGLADLVLVSGNAVRYWINRNGAVFDAERTITSADIEGDIPVRDQTTTVLYADMNGNGSTDLVWIDASGAVTYLEMFPVRPNLMSRIENNIGKVIDVRYGTSVQHMARDGGPGAWPYALPHPMTVVDELDTYDELTGVHQITRYTYHDGYYNGVAKQFAGYELVEAESPGDDAQQPGAVHEQFDIGAADLYRQGRLLVEEQYSDGRLLAVKVHEHADCPVAGLPPAGLLFPVRHVCEEAETTEHREGLADAGAYLSTRKETVYDGYGNVALTADLGVVAKGGGACAPCATAGYAGTPCGPQCLGDERYVRNEFALPEANEGRWFVSLPTRERVFGVATAAYEPANATYSERLTYYDGEAFVGLPAGQVQQGGVTRVTERVDTGGAVRDSERNRLDEHGNAVEVIDALGTVGGPDHRRLYTYDAAGRHIMRAEILLSAGGTDYRLRRDLEYDLQWDRPVEATAWMVVVDGTPLDARNSTYYAYDEFGRMTQMVRPGDTPDAPSEVYGYDIGRPKSRIITERRTVAGEPTDLEQVKCFDGHGRVYQERERIAPGRYLVSGFTVFSNGGAERQVFEPYEATSPECDAAPPAGTLSTETTYDALGRPVRIAYPVDPGDPDISVTRTEYLPLAERQWDAEDNLPGGAHYETPTVHVKNGLHHLIALERQAGPGAEVEVIQLGYNELGTVASSIDPTGVTTTQQSDLLGRVVRVTDPDSGVTTFTYDAAGNVVRQEDARGVAVAKTYDGTNRLLEQWDEADPAGTRLANRYDRRGDCAASDCTNVAGMLVQIDYPLGDGTAGRDRYGYTVRGNTRYAARTWYGKTFEFETFYDNAERVVGNRYPAGNRIDLTLDGAGRLTAVPDYINALHYDGRGQADVLEATNGTTTTWARDARMRLVQTTVQGPDDEPLVQYTYTRDAVGNVVEIVDGALGADGPTGSAIYHFDSLYRLVSAELSPDRPEASETVDIAYDAAERIVSMTSSRGAESPVDLGTYVYGNGSDAGPHAVVSAGELSFAYGPDGRMTERGDVQYTWDHLGRLTEARKAAETQAGFLYGPSVERIVKREDGHATYYLSDDFEVRDGTAVTYVRIDDRRFVQIEDPAFAATMLSDVAPATGSDDALIAAPDGVITAGDAWLATAAESDILAFADPQAVSPVAELLAASNERLLGAGAPRVRYLHHDHQGGTVAVSNEAGEVVERTEYYPHGLTRLQVGEGAHYGYTGKEQDDTTGLSFFGARYLDPQTGRWTAPDPAYRVKTEEALDERPEEALGAYGLSGNNPVNTVDPDGEKGWRIPVLGGITGTVIQGARMAFNKSNWVRPMSVRAKMGSFGGASPARVRWNYFKAGFINFMKGRSVFHGIYKNADYHNLKFAPVFTPKDMQMRLLDHGGHIKGMQLSQDALNTLQFAQERMMNMLAPVRQDMQRELGKFVQGEKADMGFVANEMRRDHYVFDILNQTILQKAEKMGQAVHVQPENKQEGPKQQEQTVKKD